MSHWLPGYPEFNLFCPGTAVPAVLANQCNGIRVNDAVIAESFGFQNFHFHNAQSQEHIVELSCSQETQLMALSFPSNTLYPGPYKAAYCSSILTFTVEGVEGAD